jgi:glycosyltransferase involved in cell wall biosynthesis
MPWLYRKYISMFLSKEMQSCIINIPEQRKYEDIAEFYASIDIFWQASWIGESFGNVIAEA